MCSIIHFLMQDTFGGKVYGILRHGGSYHRFNAVGGCLFDLISEQFGDECWITATVRNSSGRYILPRRKNG